MSNAKGSTGGGIIVRPPPPRQIVDILVWNQKLRWPQVGGSQPLYGRPERVGDLFGVVFRDGIMGTRMAVVAVVSLICSYWTGSGGWSSGSAGDPWWRWKDLASDGAFLRGLDNKHSSIVDKFRQLVCCQSLSVARISNSYVTEASDTRPFHYSHDMYGQHLRALSWWYWFYSTQYRGHHGHHINALATRTGVERGTALRKSCELKSNLPVNQVFMIG